MTIGLGCDHGGYPLKAEILKYLNEHNYETIDYGTDSAQASVDYPEYALKVAVAVRKGEVDRGILICGTGIGISIAANKVPGIRCALTNDTYSARMAREHNDANIMAIGARVIGPGLAEDIVETFLRTGFSHEERHQHRVDLIHEIEKTIEKEMRD